MAFTFTETPLKGLYIIEPKVFGDMRGLFFESYNQNDFSSAGLDASFVQDNESHSIKGVLRGLHFQIKNPQGKLVRVATGTVFDVAVDIREESDTFGQWFGLILSDENKKQLYIPQGFAHGFLTLSEKAVFMYKCTDFYHPNDQGSIIWNDKDINIDWPTGIDVILSEKDRTAKPFRALSGI